MIILRPFIQNLLDNLVLIVLFSFIPLFLQTVTNISGAQFFLLSLFSFFLLYKYIAKLFDIRSFTFVHSSEMEENSARS